MSGAVRRSFCLAGGLFGGMLWSATAAADRLQTIVVYGERSHRLLSETASLSHLVDRDSLEHPGVEHASQVLSSTPGVWVSRGSGQEQLVAIRSPVFTGSGACGAFWLAEDGIALRATGFCNANEFFDSHYEAAQQIEVFKGPHASIVGGNAQYGALNVRLPQASEVDNEVSLLANSLGYRRLHLSAGLEGERHSLGALLTGIEDDSFRADSNFKQQKISLRHEWQGSSWVSAESGVTLMHLEQETAGYVEGRDSYRDKQQVRGNLFPEAYRDADAMRAYSRWRWRKLDTQWTFTPFARRNEMDFLMHFVPWQPTESNRHDSLGWQLQWRRFLAGGTELYWSQEFEQTWGDLREFQARPSPFSPAQIPQGNHYDFSVSAQSAAINGGAYWQVTHALAFDLALRWDYTSYDYTNHLAAGSACAPGVNGCRFYRPESQTNSFGEPSLHAGFIFQWRNGIYSFGKLANGFRIPQTAELYRTQSPDPADIDPEHIRSAELGLRGERGGWFAQGALYWMENKDGIFQNSDRLYVNGVDTVHRGLEYELGYTGDVLSLQLSGQIARHTHENNPNLMGAPLQLEGLEVDTAPRHMHQASLQWRLSPRIDLGVQARYMGSYYMDVGNQFEYPGHTLVDLDITTRLSPQLEWRWALMNMFDRVYAERADIANTDTHRYFPGLERRLSTSLRYFF
jgi:iron complex outermembrane receptor protein